MSGDRSRPLVSLLLITYRQPHTIADAIAGALAQTYSPLEIIVSDDASGDGTWEAIERATAGYAGPHRLIANRNPRNLGIGAHLSQLVAMSRGELIVVAAGDDVSLPERCARCVEAWLTSDRRLDLIASALVDVDADGHVHGELRPSDLARWRGVPDWAVERPHVIGAAQAWTRRVFDRFGPLPAGTVAEDLIMVFRAIASGGAVTLPAPLVRYRRGGISRRRRTASAADVRDRLTSNARHAVVEFAQLLEDAEQAGVRALVEPVVRPQLARERHVLLQFDAHSAGSRWKRVVSDRDVPLPTRLRVFVYAACPWLLAPWFALKRAVTRQR